MAEGPLVQTGRRSHWIQFYQEVKNLAPNVELRSNSSVRQEELPMPARSVRGRRGDSYVCLSSIHLKLKASDQESKTPLRPPLRSQRNLTRCQESR